MEEEKKVIPNQNEMKLIKEKLTAIFAIFDSHELSSTKLTI